jgi:hypothetical protein
VNQTLREIRDAAVFAAQCAAILDLVRPGSLEATIARQTTDNALWLFECAEHNRDPEEMGNIEESIGNLSDTAVEVLLRSLREPAHAAG